MLLFNQKTILCECVVKVYKYLYVYKFLATFFSKTIKYYQTIFYKYLNMPTLIRFYGNYANSLVRAKNLIFNKTYRFLNIFTHSCKNGSRFGNFG